VADPADVATVDGIIAALYGSISGPAGAPRAGDRFRSLFAPDGKLVPSSAAAPGGYLYWTPDEYWSRSADRLAEIGFTEREVSRITESFGSITHVFSTYASYRGDREDPDTPFARGINSIQLLRADGRYWIMTVFWDSERPDNPIPARYLGG